MYVTLEPSHITVFPGTKNHSLASKVSGAVSIDKFKDAETSNAISRTHKFPSLSYDLIIHLHL
jgi:hypothetical protein